MRATEQGVTLALTVDADVGLVCADRRAMGQMMFNALDNALKATARGGEIVLTLARANGALRLTVADTGGTSWQRGAGVGLRLAGALAAAHGGSLSFDSRTGGGVTVTVQLPVLTRT